MTAGQRYGSATRPAIPRCHRTQTQANNADIANTTVFTVSVVSPRVYSLCSLSSLSSLQSQSSQVVSVVSVVYSLSILSSRCPSLQSQQSVHWQLVGTWREVAISAATANGLRLAHVPTTAHIATADSRQSGSYPPGHVRAECSHNTARCGSGVALCGAAPQVEVESCGAAPQVEVDRPVRPVRGHVLGKTPGTVLSCVATESRTCREVTAMVHPVLQGDDA